MFKKNVGTGDYENPQTLTSDFFTFFGCMTQDAEFVAYGGDKKFRIAKLNSGTNQYAEINALTLSNTVRNCKFSNDNTFFFVGMQQV